MSEKSLYCNLPTCPGVHENADACETCGVGWPALKQLQTIQASQGHGRKYVGEHALYYSLDGFLPPESMRWERQLYFSLATDYIEALQGGPAARTILTHARLMQEVARTPERRAAIMSFFYRDFLIMANRLGLYFGMLVAAAQSPRRALRTYREARDHSQALREEYQLRRRRYANTQGEEDDATQSDPQEEDEEETHP